MGVELLTKRHASQIAGVPGCYDRLLIFGTLPGICYAGGMTAFLYAREVRIFDYPKFAEPYRERIRENAESMAAASRSSSFVRGASGKKIGHRNRWRNEETIRDWSVSCRRWSSTYKPWHNKQSGKTYLVPNDGKCLHYYFYFVDDELGFCHVRVPTWLPCRLQICLNGHNWLADQLRRAGIEYRMADNAFTHIGDWQKAQTISDGWEAKRIHGRLTELARLCCPIYGDFATGYHWSVNQCEYATDVVFRKQADLQAIYGNLTRTAIHTVKPDNIATFLGKKLSPQFEGEAGNRFNIRIEGTRIKHTMGPVSLKLYDIATAPAVSNGRRCKKASTVFPRYENCWRLPTGVIWSSFRRLKIRAQEGTDSINSHNRWNWKAAVTRGSICSIRRMKICFAPSFAASSTSADCRTKRSAAMRLHSTAVRCHVC